MPPQGGDGRAEGGAWRERHEAEILREAKVTVTRWWSKNNRKLVIVVWPDDFACDPSSGV